jgi:NAD(P)H-dependent flavin oxidoreductase YrpB (nitropropane dioxygenase family)
LIIYARFRGWTLARAHARSGDAAAIAGYLASNGRFDQAVAAFTERYAGQKRGRLKPPAPAASRRVALVLAPCRLQGLVSTDPGLPAAESW